MTPTESLAPSDSLELGGAFNVDVLSDSKVKSANSHSIVKFNYIITLKVQKFSGKKSGLGLKIRFISREVQNIIGKYKLQLGF